MSILHTMQSIKKAMVAVVMLSFLPFTALAQTSNAEDATSSFRVEGVTYDPSIPYHEDFLGHRLGEEPVRHHMMVEYIRQLASLSDRLTLETIGYTHERRPLLLVTVTSPENHARLDAIKAQHNALVVPGGEDEITPDMPAVVWMGYGVHGAEASGMDSVVPTLYHLAAAQGPEIEEQLKNTVLLVKAIKNPDGHMRRANWVIRNQTNVLDTNPETRQHNSPWPGGRTNHYWFDLNRQWLLQTQPEAQAWMKKWHEWKPNLTLDYHEMGSNSTYYFHPGVTSRTNPWVPDEALELINTYAAFPRNWMDSEGRLYFNNEGYDNFYVGKGSTYPLVNGGIGVLYEASAARANTVETINGLRSYRENIRKHYRTSLASVEAASNMRGRLLSYQKRFYDQSLDMANDDDLKAYIVQAPEDPVRMSKFIELMNNHRVKVHRVMRDVNVGNKSFRAGDAYVIPLDQAQYRFIKSVLEHRLEYGDKTFYDVSTWTLSRSFNLDQAELRGRNFRSNIVGPEVTADELITPAPAPEKSRFAYAFTWHDYYSPKALYRLLKTGVMTKVMTQPSTMQTNNGLMQMDRGTIIVHLDRQAVSHDDIFAIVQDIASKDGIAVHAIQSSSTPTGPDLGSRTTMPLVEPHVLMAVDEGVTPYDAGEIWHLLDFRMDIKLSMRSLSELGRSDWSRYTHLVMPNGRYNSLSQSDRQKIMAWVRDGGTLVAFKNAAGFVQRDMLGMAPEKSDSPDLPRQDYAMKSGEEALRVIGGSIFESDLDITHPLAFGYVRRDFGSHKSGEMVLQSTDNPYGVVAQYKPQPLVSGYASQANVNRIANTPMMIGERVGRGSVVLFADNPNFRGIWYGGNKLFLNSLFFSKAFSAPSRRGLEEE